MGSPSNSLRPFHYILATLRQDLSLDSARHALRRLEELSNSISSEIGAISRLISEGKDTAAISSTLSVVDRVLEENLDTELQGWHNLCIKNRLGAPASEGSGSWWFDDTKAPISSRLFSLVGLLAMPRKNREVSLPGLAGCSGMSAKYEVLGREYYERWSKGRVVKECEDGGLG